MRILGIDPGLTRCGLGIIDTDDRRGVKFIDVRVVRSAPGADIAERVHHVAAGIAEHLDAFRPDAVAIERVFAQQNVSTVIGVANISGAVMFAAGERGIPVTMYTPSEVKAAVSGYGSADKAQVQNMVSRVLKLDVVPKPADAADALAIAICHAWQNTSRSTARAQGDETMAQKIWREAESRAGRHN